MHLFLNHARTARYQIPVLYHLKENLRRDVIRIVPGQHKLPPAKNGMKIHLQEVTFNDIVAQRREMLTQVWHRIEVNLHNLKLSPLLQYILRQDPHSRPNLQHRNIRTGIHRVCYAASHMQIRKEVLPQEFLWFYVVHKKKYEIE